MGKNSEPNILFGLNQINDNSIQIYGKVNGVAELVTRNNQDYWTYEIKFFNSKNHLIKLTTSQNNMTIHNEQKLEEAILGVYNKENQICMN